MHHSQTDTNIILQRIFRNAGSLLGGKAIAGVLSLLYLAIAGRALGPEGLGYLVLAHTYVFIVSSLARFQSWQAVIHFGAELKDTDPEQFKTLIRYTVKLDIISAIIAVFLALIGLQIVAQFMNWPETALPVITAYCFAAPFMIAATPIGVLRLNDRFKVLGWQYTLMPATRFIGTLILWGIGAEFSAFLVVWLLSAVIEGASMWILGWLELKKQGQLPSITKNRGDKADPVWLPFMIKTNLSSSLTLSQTHLPLLIVGAILGSAVAGLFQLAVNLTNLIAHPTNMLNHATYPELSKIHANEGKIALRQVAIKSVQRALKIGIPFGVAYILLRNYLPVWVAGSDFAAASTILAMMAVVQIARIAAVILESSVLACGQAGFVLIAQSVAALTLILLLVFGLPYMGGVGVPIALAVGTGLLIFLYLLQLYMGKQTR